MEPLSPPDAVADDVTLTLTLMLALERLSPLERAAFLLHDVFGVALAEIAASLERKPAAVRQLAARARRHVQAGRPRYPVDPTEADHIARAFFAASRDGDTAALAALLAEQAELHSDGGGRVLAYPRVIRGRARILRLFAGLADKPYFAPVLVRIVRIDGLPGYVSTDSTGVLQTTALAVVDGRIEAVYMTRNPDKLRHVADEVRH